MAIIYHLERNNRVLVRVYTDPLDITEVVKNIYTIHSEILDRATQKVHIISDFSAITQFPKNLLASGTSMDKLSHPMEGALVLVSGNLFLQTLVGVMNKVSVKHKLIGFKTMPEAYAFIDKLLAEEQQSTTAP
jgi:hypothetical protein